MAPLLPRFLADPLITFSQPWGAIWCLLFLLLGPASFSVFSTSDIEHTDAPLFVLPVSISYRTTSWISTESPFTVFHQVVRLLKMKFFSYQDDLNIKLVISRIKSPSKANFFSVFYSCLFLSTWVNALTLDVLSLFCNYLLTLALVTIEYYGALAPEFSKTIL